MIAGPTVSVRMNTHGGGVSTIQLSKSEMLTSTAETNDIAMIGLPALQDTYDQQAITLDRELLKRNYETWRPGLGDEVATVGLYSSHYGQDRNVPVVRIGNIARLPGEPVLSKRGYVKAFLIETKSILGLSGSPVYVNVPHITLSASGSIRTLHGDGLDAFPIGMMLGYHVVSTLEDQIPVPSTEGETAKSETSLDERNTGFAVVVPIEAILDVVEGETALLVLDSAAAREARKTGAK
jgi:hypothetical protein